MTQELRIILDISKVSKELHHQNYSQTNSWTKRIIDKNKDRETHIWKWLWLWLLTNRSSLKCKQRLALWRKVDCLLIIIITARSRGELQWILAPDATWSSQRPPLHKFIGLQKKLIMHTIFWDQKIAPHALQAILSNVPKGLNHDWASAITNRK